MCIKSNINNIYIFFNIVFILFKCKIYHYYIIYILIYFIYIYFEKNLEKDTITIKKIYCSFKSFLSNTLV